MKQKIKSAIMMLFGAATTLVVLFLLAAFIWILITTKDYSSYYFILSRIMKNGGTYSALLAAVVAAVAFQSIKDAEVKRKESEEKIKQIGQYTIAFQKEEEQDKRPITCGDVIVIKNDQDFDFEHSGVLNQSFCAYSVQFLTSGKESTNLQCIMAFEDDYFCVDKNRKKILNDYYGVCEKLKLPNPLYCASRQTNPELKCESRNRFINLIIRVPEDDAFRFIWFSAITDQGFLVFIKVKLKLENRENKHYCRLISQFSYSVENGKLKPLYYSI